MANNRPYENFEKTDMLECYLLSNKSRSEAAELYLNRYPERRQPNPKMFNRVYKNIQNFGVLAKPRPKQYEIENRENDETLVLGVVEATPQTSVKEVEASVGISKTRTQRILKKHKYFPYKERIVHHLRPGDAERRLEFCQWYLQHSELDENFSHKIIWSDEAFFSSDEMFNRNNTRFWSQENPYDAFERARQGRFGFSVACFVLGTSIKFFIYEGSLTGQRYQEILEEIFPQLLEEIPQNEHENIYFQQDGAGPHNAAIIRGMLNEMFPGRWIGTYGPTPWPARSPDLSILDFFLWGFLKNRIYKRSYDNIEDLKNAVREAFRYLRARRIATLNALTKIQGNCEMCIDVNGRQFEHLN